MMAGDIPVECPTCGTPIPHGRTRCPGCGRVFGEDNRCPSCNAIAAVRAAEDGHRCLACGGPRERKPGTVVLARGPDGMQTAAARGGAVGLRLVGMASIAAGVSTAALAAALIPGAGGVAAAAVLGLLGAAVGAVSLRAGSRLGSGAGGRRRAAREGALIELAERRGGRITATDAARELGMGLADADSVLTEMADGSRVAVEVSGQGVVEYVFREVRPPPPRRVRVDGDPSSSDIAPSEQDREQQHDAQSRQRDRGRGGA